MIIKKIDEINEKVGTFINKAFTEYAIKCCVELNFEEYCFVAEEDGVLVGAITGRTYYNEVHIGDLIIDEKYRRLRVGSKLVNATEETYAGKGYSKISLTTFGFQTPEFKKNWDMNWSLLVRMRIQNYASIFILSHYNWI